MGVWLDPRCATIYEQMRRPNHKVHVIDKKRREEIRVRGCRLSELEAYHSMSVRDTPGFVDDERRLCSYTREF